MDAASSRAVTNTERVCDACLMFVDPTPKTTAASIPLSAINTDGETNIKPTCSRCAENDRICTYFTKKRKPGPMKGSSVARRRTSPSTGSSIEQAPLLNGGPTSFHGERISASELRYSGPDSTLSVSNGPVPVDSQSPSASSWEGYRMIDVESKTSVDSLGVAQWGLSPEAELDLLQEYFESIQPLYPLFRKQNLLNQYNTGQIPQALLAAIFAVTAVLSENEEIAMRGPSTLGEHYATLTRQACAPLCMSDIPATISDLRALFLLALYEFRTSPNRRAWATAGHLVRLAYHYGLHQVDNTANCSFYEPCITTSEDLESWRYLWWSIYILDTYCNSTASTPSNIDLDSLCTALPTCSVDDWTNGGTIPANDRIYIRGDVEDLSNILKATAFAWQKNDENLPEIDANFVIRIVITSQMREVCHLRRAHNQNPAGNFQRKHQVISNQLAATRLALPARYQDPQRKLYLGEQKEDHALRLVNLLEMHISQLQVLVPESVVKDNQNEILLANWDSCMGFVDEVMQIIRYWNPSTQKLTDPSICYIIFIAMVLIHMESKLESRRNGTAREEAVTRSSWQLLHLFLQQLSNQWLLPKALIRDAQPAAAAEKFRNAASGPITMSDAYHISKSLQRPLSFRPRFEGKAPDSNVDYSLNFQFPITPIDSNNLYDWLSTFNQGDINSV
ncbi:uncharacterized protein PAC_10041 [Phialocephala subalpina]|uniref:Xylanolytic transcriptional activator regulatory domain-containing protein n=1 Tax=Phialocephala subalpina TaxID=576137 RepID=A0A1L7X554_9HELO|nr:uncharacterized protein PAC_10041 [Phialocephala subalpina]